MLVLKLNKLLDTKIEKVSGDPQAKNYWTFRKAVTSQDCAQMNIEQFAWPEDSVVLL